MKFRLLSLVLLFTASVCMTAQPAEGSSVVPLTRPWLGLPQVPVTLNGNVEASFVVDTAASETVLTNDTIRRLGLTGRGQRASVRGATGNTAVEYYRLARMRVGNQSYRRLGAYSFSANAAPVETDGLLGADVLRRHAVEFDIPNDALILHSPRTDMRALGNWHDIPAREQENGFLIVQVTIGATSMPAVIDTGAVQNFMNNEAARRLGLRLFPDSASRTPITGATGHVQDINQLEVSRFQIGDVEFGASRMGVADLAIFDALELGDGPVMLLSAESLVDRRFVLDYPHNRLLIERQR